MAKPERLRVIQPTNDEIRTKQGMKDEVNINSIIKRWRDGIPLPENHRNPQYGDFTGVGDFHEMMGKVDEAREEFMRLPSEIRREVGQDVGVFLEMANDPEGLAKLIELGLDVDQAPPKVAAPVEEVIAAAIEATRAAVVEEEKVQPAVVEPAD